MRTKLSRTVKPKTKLSTKIALVAAGMIVSALGGVLLVNGGATRTSSQSGAWSDPATWGGATPPAITDAVTITHTVTMTANCSVDRLTIEPAGCLKGDGGAYIFTIDGTSGDDLVINGTFDANGTTMKINRNNQLDGTGTMNFFKFDLNGKTLKIKNTCTSTINFNGAGDPILNPGTLTPGSGCSICLNGSSAQELSSDANVKFNNLLINNTAGVTMKKNFTSANLLGNLTIQDGTLYNGGLSLTGAANGTLTIANGATLDASGLTTAFTGFGTTVLGASSTVNYSGTTQSIATAAYGALVISGSGTKTLSSNSSVKTLALTAGNLLLNGKTLTIDNSSSSAVTRVAGVVTSELTNNSSKVKWNIGTSTGSFLFPFANSTGAYVPFTFNVTSPGTGAGDITVATYSTAVNNLPYPSGVTNVNANGADNSTYTVDRFWQIDAANYTSNPTATLIFTASATEAGSIGSMRAQRWNGSNWDNPLPGQMYAANTVTVTNVSTFSPWTLAGTSNPLPVTLTRFDAVAKGEHVNINWTTATEMNNDFFTIERSTDKINFQKLAVIKGAGTTTVKNEYSAEDPEPVRGTLYYRLRQTDYNGKTEVFGPVALDFKEAKADKSFEIVKVFPNPFSNGFKVEFDSKESNVLSMRLVSMDGRIVRETLIDCEEGNNTFSMENLESLAEGTYLLNLLDAAGYRQSVRLIKRK